jgi:hypothetical protein
VPAASVQVNSKKGYLQRLDDVDIEELSIKTDPVLSEALPGGFRRDIRRLLCN